MDHTFKAGKAIRAVPLNKAWSTHSFKAWGKDVLTLTKKERKKEKKEVESEGKK